MKKDARATQKGKIILKGKRDPTLDLWIVLIWQIEKYHNQNHTSQDKYDQSLAVEVLEAVSVSVGEEVTAESLAGISRKAVSLMVDQYSLSNLKSGTEQLGVVRELAWLASLRLPPPLP